LPLVIAAAVGLVVGGIASAAIVSAMAEKPAKRPKSSASQTAAAVRSGAPAGATSAPVEAPKPTLIERAAAGEPEAVKQLEARPVAERTSEEATALAYARAAEKRVEIAELKRKITLVPKIIAEDKDTRSRIKELAADREVATAMLSMLVTLPDTIGTDLLYTLYRDMKANTESAELAEGLLYSKDVRAKLSPGLAALLDLRKAEKCEDALTTLKRLKEDGDRRALGPMMRLHNKRGCGERKLDDCWKCLRAPDVLKEVTAEVAKRAPP
jgi:hypothetical protein